jgi:protein-S-isoprenylcysteine O-methyltransferase Ste14
MAALSTFVLAVWAVFWIYWLVSAFGAKQAAGRRPGRPIGLALIIVGGVVLHAFRHGTASVSSPIAQTVGVILLLSGLGVAVWARINLGRNWGMPMTEKQEPELVTSGPYEVVRHPIYSGLLLAVLGTALAINLYWLIVLALMAAYFIYSATVEERLMESAFPASYPGYKARTKMLIPFVL